MKIGLDAGHGINTAGKRTPDGIHEWELNNAVCNYIAEYMGGYAEIIRTDDTTGKTDIALDTRRNKAVNNCDVLISIHHNALYDDKFSNATGVETFTHNKWGTATAKELSKMLAENMSKQTSLKNRGAKEKGLAVIATSKIPAVLCEGGFMDGEKDSYYIRTEEGQRAYAKAVSETLIGYFKLSKGGYSQQTNSSSGAENTTKPQNSNSSNGVIATIQDTLNKRYGLTIATDNLYGNETKKALVIALQTELNRQYNKGIDVDGIFGVKTKEACVNVKKGASGNITYTLQSILYCKGYNIAVDSIYGVNTENAVKDFQKKNSLAVDGIAGKNTFAKLFE